jgi:hypothetical protein
MTIKGSSIKNKLLKIDSSTGLSESQAKQLLSVEETTPSVFQQQTTSAIDRAMKSMSPHQSMMDNLLGSNSATSAIDEIMKSMGEHKSIIDRTMNSIASSSLIHSSLLELNNSALLSSLDSNLLSTMAGSLSNSSFRNYIDTFDNTSIESEFDLSSKKLSQASNTSEFSEAFKKLPPIFQLVIFFTFLQIFLPQVNSISANLLTPVVTSYLDGSRNSNREKINDIKKLPSKIDSLDTHQLRFITGNNVRLRVDASTKSEVLDEMVLGQVVTILSKKKNWIEISYEYENGEVMEGWVFTRYTARFVR